MCGVNARRRDGMVTNGNKSPRAAQSLSLFESDPLSHYCLRRDSYSGFGIFFLQRAPQMFVFFVDVWLFV